MTDEKMPRRVWIGYDRNMEQRVFSVWPPITGETLATEPAAYILATDHDKLRELARAVVEAHRVVCASMGDGIAARDQAVTALAAHLDATEKESGT